MWCLTESIERLIEEAHSIRSSGVDEPNGLLGQNMFLEMAVEERVGNIQLLGGPFA